MSGKWNVLVTGGAGYVGSALVPALLQAGHMVTVLDLFLYGEDVLSAHPNLRLVKGDLRNRETVDAAVSGCDAVIHLACVSNDPSFDLNPDLGKSINFDAFPGLVEASQAAGVRRFIYASSSSVYGIKEGVSVTESLELEPLTDYSKFKAMCEVELERRRRPGFETVIVRPATVCGYAPRLRLDLVVNILTSHAITNRKVRIFGGVQKRPNIHIKDMVRAYLQFLDEPGSRIDGAVFNVGYQNHTLDELGDIVREQIGPDVTIVHEPTDDLRSYHVSSEKIAREIGFVPEFTIADAVADLKQAFDGNLVQDPMNNPLYYNIKRMKELGFEDA